MRSEDLEFCDQLRMLAGWNQRREDWVRFMRLAPGGCFLEEWQGRPAGTVVTIQYGDDIGWIGMLLVHPEFRGRGLGTALLNGAIDHLRSSGACSVKLDATPEGFPLYRRLGFRSEFPICRWQLEPNLSHTVRSAATVRPLTRSDIPAVARLDAEAFGAVRIDLLADLAGDCLTSAVLEKDGAVGGFGMLRAGAVADYVGPLVAQSSEDAEAIVAALLTRNSKRAIFWDCPVSEACVGPQHLGFRQQRVLTRMFLGENRAARKPATYWGLADPACG